MDIALWTSSESGVLRKPSLLLNACRGKAFGSIIEYPGGKIENALFTYLSGVPDAKFVNLHPELFLGKYLVCMSSEWEEFLRSSPDIAAVMRRRMMCPMNTSSSKNIRPLPDDYTVSPYDEDTFNSHPFEHGKNYADFTDFLKNGSGAKAQYKGETVASASSFITFGSDVELDVSTAPEHRRKGLADSCVASMLCDCALRGFTVHWDAQNDASANMAISHGFVPEQDYAVWILKR